MRERGHARGARGERDGLPAFIIYPVHVFSCFSELCNDLLYRCEFREISFSRVKNSRPAFPSFENMHVIFRSISEMFETILNFWPMNRYSTWNLFFIYISFRTCEKVRGHPWNEYYSKHVALPRRNNYHYRNTTDVSFPVGANPQKISL